VPRIAAFAGPVTANGHVNGGPHDATYPLSRFVHWMGDDDVLVADANPEV
jgi:hypothetical protein